MNTDSPAPTIEILTSIGGSDADRIRRLFDETLPLDHQDDRFDSWPTASTPSPPATQTSAVAISDKQVIGYLGGPIDNGQAELDAIVHPEAADPGGVLEAMVDAVTPAVIKAGATTAQLWGRPAQAWHVEVVEARGGAQTRALHQMRCVLPAGVDPIESRDFDPETDLEALRTVNNRAFASHPDQGSQTTESLHATMAEPWFRPEGIRIHEREGRVAGFCWTKIHAARSRFTRPEETSSPLGEIYVIGVDPDFHGQGLGAPMTAAGLHWMHDQGLEVGMLYVEADNVPAVKTYERLGFSVLRTDRAWSLPLGGS